MAIDTIYIIILLSCLVILSYLFNFISNKLKIPSVILLLGTGLAIQYFGKQVGIELQSTQLLLELFGTLGLILIVLEGSLDLEITQKKFPLIARSMLSALLILIVTTAGIATVIVYWLGEGWQRGIVYAIPMAVISSAIAIPSVTRLAEHKKEFIIYESTFSDILGIMLFNFAIMDNIMSSQSLTAFFGNVAIIIAVSIVSSILLIFMLNYVTTHVKFFLIFAILILIYGIGKKFHLSSLVLIMTFGLVLNNYKYYIKGWLAKYLHFETIGSMTRELKLVTAESAFLIRTFFFILFGYSMDLMTLANTEVILIGLFIIIIILFIRFLFLKFISRTNVFPELFIAPRGLITIILFLSIPATYHIDKFSEGVVFFVIIVSSLIMMGGLMAWKQPYEEHLTPEVGDFDEDDPLGLEETSPQADDEENKTDKDDIDPEYT